MGFKTLSLLLGVLLAAIWTIMDFFINWLGGMSIGVITNWALGMICCLILFPFFGYIAHILWKFAHTSEDLIG